MIRAIIVEDEKVIRNGIKKEFTYMYKVIIWGTGTYYDKHLNLIKMQEKEKKFSVVAITSNDGSIYKLDSYLFVPKEKISSISYDYCIVAIENFQSALKELASLNIDKDKVIPVRVLSIPYFDFDAYIKIKTSNISMISRSCWGGFCYNYLGLEFRSPFINMSFTDIEFNKLIQYLDYYLSQSLIQEKNTKRDIPVGRLDDILLYFNHYVDFEEAKECWERRIQRINYDNLFIISSTLSESVALEFDELPYNNKFIFVPFVNELTSSINIDYNAERDGITIAEKSNYTANGKLNILNLFALLNRENNYLRKE